MAKRRAAPRGRLDLVPIMNLVTILIPFLLMSAQFVSLSVLDVTQPAFADDGDPKPEPEALGLRLAVTESGYVLTSDHPMLDSGETRIELDCSPGACPRGEGADDHALREVLAEIKVGWPDDDAVVLVPDSTVSYQALITAMDACRGSIGAELFPAVMVAGGAPGPR